MAKWSASIGTWFPVAVADAAAFTNSTIPAFHGLAMLTGLRKTDVVEIYMGGQATSSAPMYMVLARDSLQGSSTTPTAGTSHKNAPLDPGTNTLVSCMSFTSSITAAQRSATDGLLALPFNGFGGIVRWVAPPGSEIRMFGSSQPYCELSLSAFTGSASGVDPNIGSHIIYETY